MYVRAQTTFCLYLQHQKLAEPRENVLFKTRIPFANKSLSYSRPEPDGDGQTAMMNHVEGREMRKLFPQHKKERVEKINELGEVVPPGHVQGSQADVAEIDESQGRLKIFFFFNIKLFFSTIFIFKGFFGVLQKL